MAFAPKNRKTVLLTLLIFTGFVSDAQVLRRPVAASYISTTAYSLLHADVFSFTSNPASLSQLKSAAIGVYGERRFMVNELSDYTIAIGLPTSSGNFGGEFLYNGFSDYNETEGGLAYGRKLGPKMDIGAQFNYQGIRITGYDPVSTISCELGMILHVTDRFHTGILISNPIGGNFGHDLGERLPFVYSVGFGYDASDKFFLSMAIGKEESQPVNVLAGFQYKFHPKLSARAGISSGTSSGWLGMGILFSSCRLDLITGYHPQLGITPGFLLIFSLKSKNE
jgi:hypothetical protein